MLTVNEAIDVIFVDADLKIKYAEEFSLKCGEWGAYITV